jgi:maleate isomerase
VNAVPQRIGLIVPSSNTTIETEVPEMLRRVSATLGRRFTFHSSRAVLHTVDDEGLDRMVGQLDRCGAELTDARVDVIVYACLVALMARGHGAHADAERRLEDIVATAGTGTAVVSSAGALVRTIQGAGMERVAILTPYVKPLTAKVAGYLEAEGIEVVDTLSLEVADNVEVGRLDPTRLPDLAAQMDLRRADGLVISACVQMPSLAAIPVAEERLGLPVMSAATATVRELLVRLGLPPVVEGGGAVLSEAQAPSAVGAD